jgi:hypothetical protein
MPLYRRKPTTVEARQFTGEPMDGVHLMAFITKLQPYVVTTTGNGQRAVYG